MTLACACQRWLGRAHLCVAEGCLILLARAILYTYMARQLMSQACNGRCDVNSSMLA